MKIGESASESELRFATRAAWADDSHLSAGVGCWSGCMRAMFGQRTEHGVNAGDACGVSAVGFYFLLLG